jgi:hypothetical protein
MALCVIMTLKDINLGVKFPYLFLMFSFVFSPGPAQNGKNGAIFIIALRLQEFQSPVFEQ